MRRGGKEEDKDSIKGSEYREDDRGEDNISLDDGLGW
jgi:hypothetical protein